MRLPTRKQVKAHNAQQWAKAQKPTKKKPAKPRFRLVKGDANGR
jgi:hypothetical protein